MPISASVAVGMVNELYAELATRRTGIASEEAYFRGDQPLRFASEKWREWHASRYVGFSDNWCQPVAAAPNDRLRAIGFRLDDEPKRSDAEKLLWSWWQGNDMDAQSSQGWLHSIVTSRSFVLVWGDDDDQPTATWERSDQVIVATDPERPNRRLAALKTWHDGTTEFATLYTADEVWKFSRHYSMSTRAVTEKVIVPPGSAAEGFFNQETPTGLVIPGAVESGGWTERRGRADNTWPLPNPIGVVPVVEMPNRPLLGAEPLSEISGTRAMQDAINLQWAYLFNASDHASFSARVVMGQEPPKIPILDENGQKIGEKSVDLKKLSEDRILWLTGQNTKIAQWDVAKLDVFTQVIEVAVAHIAAQTRTPPHFMLLGKGLVNVGPDGIKAAADGLVNKVGEMHLYLAPPTREVFRLMALAAGDKGLAQQARAGVVQWKDAENHSQTQLVDAIGKLGAVGFPFEWLAEQYGLSQTEIARVMAMRAAQAAADPLGQIARGINPPVLTDGLPI